ncbi:hypothetical protein KC343_g12063 [Hortaea werneckii]|nr:hypothetical protein KC352_g20956 [Hortaea werneckii]KAI7558292.1 hypothetical protein KC317_g11094 [Hortaea werneckii]KAI7607313.1 hypothetical protein KC346_g10131 [Hortaea werneckii]KAI7610091.1 hypothetical protein KC343_g12063 [Hortaea werneckii]KAI7667342.1 hypothetical protein KC319_g6706 [Hortaea werneckii]
MPSTTDIWVVAFNQPMEVSSFGNNPAAQPPTLNSTTRQDVLTFESSTQDYSGMAQSLAQFQCDSSWLQDVVQQDLPGVGFYLPTNDYSQLQDIDLASEQLNETRDSDPLAELARTTALEWEFDTFIDYHGYNNNTEGRVNSQSGAQEPASLLTKNNEADHSASAVQGTQNETRSPVSAHFEDAFQNYAPKI